MGVVLWVSLLIGLAGFLKSLCVEGRSKEDCWVKIRRFVRKDWGFGSLLEKSFENLGCLPKRFIKVLLVANQAGHAHPIAVVASQFQSVLGLVGFLVRELLEQSDRLGIMVEIFKDP